MAARLIQASSVNIANDVDTLVEIWCRTVDAINVPLYEEWEKDTKIALDHVKDRLKYIRLEENGPKLGEISTSCPLVEPSLDQGKYSVTNNGWIWGATHFRILPFHRRKLTSSARSL
ncbi:hypothetical protein EDB19DRAFT_2047374 [Suillus lakei]|nr:hypothetical protein EDB19DRAFT_2047374 [Suillus lakei]